jgi:hypothetical protein
MTLHLASPERVARSWLLEKLLGPEKKPSSAPSRGRPLTPQQRERALEDAYKSLKDDLVRGVKQEFAGLDAAEKRIAGKHGIDPLFLNWYVVNGQHWPPMPARTKSALRTMQSARMWFAEVPSSWANMTVPSMDNARSRDAAFRELGEWFLKNFVASVERKFTNTIWKKSRELLSVFHSKGSPSKASILLLRDFKNRLGEDRFQLKPAVRRLVELFD